MPKYYVNKRVFSDYETIIEADNMDEVYDILAEGVEMDFIQSDDDIIIEERK